MFRVRARGASAGDEHRRWIGADLSRPRIRERRGEKAV